MFIIKTNPKRNLCRFLLYLQKIGLISEIKMQGNISKKLKIPQPMKGSTNVELKNAGPQ